MSVIAKGSSTRALILDLGKGMREHSTRLLYLETTDHFQVAKHDRQIKGWQTDKKMALIGKVSWS